MVRLKHRYVLVELLPPAIRVAAASGLQLDEAELYRSVVQAVERIHGDYGVAAVSVRLVVKYCNPVTRVALLRCSHAAHRLLASALPFVTSVGGRELSLRTLYVGATVMHCYKFLRRYQERQLEAIWQSVEPAQRNALRQAVMSVILPNVSETRALPTS